MSDMNNDDDLIESLEESYFMADADDDEEYMFSASDLENIWQHGYRFAWTRLSLLLLILSAVNLLALIAIGIALWIK